MNINRYQILCLAPLLFASMQSFSAAYQRCSESQQESLAEKFNLLTHQFDHLDAQTFKSCIILNNQKNIQPLAISQPISYQDYNDMEHDLNLYIIDSNKNKILNKYKDPISHTTDAERYDGVKIHSAKFSTLNNTHVVGIETGISHEGGFTYSHDNLSLFKINANYSIQPIFSGVGTHDYGYLRGGSCISQNSASIQRIFILSKNTTNGLQDIILKETKKLNETNDQTCKSVERQFKQQQIIKFNGQKYKLEHDRLLGIDDIF